MKFLGKQDKGGSLRKACYVDRIVRTEQGAYAEGKAASHGPSLLICQSWGLVTFTNHQQITCLCFEYSLYSLILGGLYTRGRPSFSPHNGVYRMPIRWENRRLDFARARLSRAIK